MSDKQQLRVTLSYERCDDRTTHEDFRFTFLSDEGLGQTLEKMELFLQHMGFVTDGKELRLVDTSDRLEGYSDYISIDDNMSYGHIENVTTFPTTWKKD